MEKEHEVKLQLILDALPHQRRTGLFSATVDSRLSNLVKARMRNPFYVEVYSSSKLFVLNGKRRR